MIYDLEKDPIFIQLFQTFRPLVLRLPSVGMGRLPTRSESQQARQTEAHATKSSAPAQEASISLLHRMFNCGILFQPSTPQVLHCQLPPEFLKMPTSRYQLLCGRAAIQIKATLALSSKPTIPIILSQEEASPSLPETTLVASPRAME